MIWRCKSVISLVASLQVPPYLDTPVIQYNPLKHGLYLRLLDNVITRASSYWELYFRISCAWTYLQTQNNRLKYVSDCDTKRMGSQEYHLTWDRISNPAVLGHFRQSETIYLKYVIHLIPSCIYCIITLALTVEFDWCRWSSTRNHLRTWFATFTRYSCASRAAVTAVNFYSTKNTFQIDHRPIQFQAQRRHPSTQTLALVLSPHSPGRPL